jgi:addiction module HigA family antidote
MSIMKTTTEKSVQRNSVERGRKETRPRHPGALLREIVVPASGLTQTEIAERLGVSRRSVNMILNEQRPMTVDMAHRFGKLFGNGARIWINMQQAVDLWDAEHEHEAEYSQIKPLQHAA